MNMAHSTKMAVMAALALAFAALVFAAAGPAPARAAAPCTGCRPWWRINESTLPHNLPPGGEGQIAVIAEDRGDAGLDSEVVLSDKLPAGLEAKSASLGGGILSIAFEFMAEAMCKVEAKEVTCNVTEEFLSILKLEIAYSHLELFINVKVAGGAHSGEENQVTVSGGGAPRESISRPITVSAEPTRFGVEDYEMHAEGPDGAPVTQAGAHPFQLTTVLTLNQGTEAKKPPASVKDLRFELPQGLIGNPTPFPECPLTKFTSNAGEGQNSCPDDTVVGVASASISFPVSEGDPVTITSPLFALVPSKGEPARFGFDVFNDLVYLDTSVRTGGDYGVTVTAKDISEIAGFISSRVTFWGVPGDPRHDSVRGWNCIDPQEHAPACTATEQVSPPPLLTLPTSCAEPIHTAVTADSWQAEGAFTAPLEYTFLDELGRQASMTGCNQLPFAPEIKVAPDIEDASSPSGLSVEVHVPQDAALNGKGVAESAVKKIEVALPTGVTLNPGGAGGLRDCSLLSGKEAAQEQLEAEGRVSGINLETRQPANCPKQSKIATAKITTPLLPNPLEGAVYLAKPDPLGALEPGDNPFNSLVAMYLVAEDPVSGVLVKLKMHVVLNEATGQVTAIVESPQLPFEDAELHFFGGSRAPLATPSLCGSYTTNATFTPWSGSAPVTASSTLTIASGPNGSPCPSNPTPFAPEFNAGTTNNQAGGFSELRTTMGHPDEDQALGGLKMTLPPGLMGSIAHVKLCQEPQAAEGTCGPESLIGHTTVTAGLGSTPAVVARPGNVYITGPYKGAPYGLSIANPAETGPFDLEKGSKCDCIVVRAKVEVDPHTAQLTITSDPLPSMIDGIPLDLQHVAVQIDRPDFTFNPTSCAKMKIEGGMSSADGAVAPVSQPFQVANCARLPFHPTFSASTNARHTHRFGASLHVVLGSQSGDANIKYVRVELPKQMPSVLKTLQQACLVEQFDTDPAGCPAASIVGHAVAHSPVVAQPLSGPAYFVSHGGAKFPELIIVLQGEGFTVDLNGETFISKAGVTSSTFNTVPDVPVSSFELTLPTGSNPALTGEGDFCAQPLLMPTRFVGQNNDVVEQKTQIAVEGCKPRIRVLAHRVNGSAATITVNTPFAGTLTAHGKYITSASRRFAGGGGHSITVSLSARARDVLAKHRDRRLKVTIHLRLQPGHGRHVLSSSVTVLMR